MNNETTRQRIASLYGRPGTSFNQDLDAILAEFVIIPRADLPAVEDFQSYLRVDGAVFSARDSIHEHKRAALNCLAIAEHFEAKNAAGAKRDARRDEIARDIHTTAYGDMSTVPGYANSNNALQEAIDRIIALEEAAA